MLGDSEMPATEEAIAMIFREIDNCNKIFDLDQIPSQSEEEFEQQHDMEKP
jgi:hypothetical protein